MTEDEKTPKVYENAQQFFDALEEADTIQALDLARNKITENRGKIAPPDLDSLRNLFDARKAMIEITV